MVVGLVVFSRKLLASTLVFAAAVLWLGVANASGITTVVETDGSFNEMFERAVISFGGFSGLVAGAAYILGILLVFAGILKIKDHVEDPARVPMREPFIRLVIGGAMFALPFVINMLTGTFGNQTAVLNTGVMVNSATSLTGSLVCNVTGGGTWGGIFGSLTGGTLSNLICNMGASFAGLTGLLNAMIYLGGVVLVVWGLMQLKDHVIDPRSMPLPVPLKKLLVAGIFFAFPFFLKVAYNTFAGDNVLIGTDILSVVSSIVGFLTGTGTPGSCGGAGGLLGGIGGGIGSIIGSITGTGTSAVGGLDCMFIRLISDVSGPLQAVTSLFCYLAGIICIIIAVRRLMESTDKGVRGPLGTGTFGLLILGGVLLSFNTLLATVSGSLFPTLGTGLGIQTLQQNATLTYAPGLGSSGVASINSVLTSVLAFSFLLGMLSILRGAFILKDVADGGNGSIMAGLTHVLGGGMAVNLGPLITAVQNTLGLTSVGIAFS
jgi:hypothetical protein